jgi:hypothetical protein
VMEWNEPPGDSVEQVTAYADDLRRRYPELTTSCHVVCTISGAGYRFFELD